MDELFGVADFSAVKDLGVAAEPSQADIEARNVEIAEN
jgi:hypothetical protein